jgi:hypothetical protein
VYRFTDDGPMEVEELSDRLWRMTHDQLLSYGKAAAYMRKPKVNLGRRGLNGVAANLRMQPGVASRRERRYPGIVRRALAWVGPQRSFAYSALAC